jgi:hypothetical protein
MAKALAVIEPEVLPARQVAGQMSPTGLHLPDIAQQVRLDMEELNVLSDRATFLGLRVGLNLLRAKAALPHGEFLPWQSSELPIYSRQHLNRFQRLAEDFVALHGLATEKVELLIEADAKKPGKAKELVQMAFDFLGSKSLNEIFAERGIKKPVENRGGARAGAGRPSLTPADRAALAQGNWQDIYAKVIQEMKTRSFVYLERAELENLDATLMDLRRDIAEVLNPKGK